MMENKLVPSFGRRKARKLRATAHKAYEEILPTLKLDIKKEALKKTEGEIWLEIGFGGGEHMLEQLAKNPSISMIGCEPFMNGVAKFLAHLPPQDYHRVKIWHEDVRYLLELIPLSYFSKVFILFPDPWPKKRHHSRRLITKDFILKLWPSLKQDALLCIASDDASYVEQIQEILLDYPNLIHTQGPSSPLPEAWENRPADWPQTRYEQKALSQGKRCAYMVFQKKE